MKEYMSVVSIAFAGNNLEADSKEDYIEKLKDSFMEEIKIFLARNLKIKLNLKVLIN